MFEKYWSLFLVTSIGLIVAEHPYLGIGLSFIGFALAKHKEDRPVRMRSFAVESQKHEPFESYASIQ
ncbi:MAG: hypothetical protein WBL02_09265 [Methanomethylovorans sp.]|uniref:hypothetical protein n=1 Tax=Methanomethylovorans sp. TaxID=2758717 RepID=UPI000A6F3178|nr:hypothetical protein [Methanomethylovorans sp.]